MATFNSCELRVRPARSAHVRLTSKRTLFESTTNWTMPPSRENSGMSLTVRTLVLESAVKISLTRLSSDELMNRMRQVTASRVFEIRLITTFLPFMFSRAIVVSKLAPNGSCPNTQMGKESSPEDVKLSGHSTNLPSLYRYAALTSYSVGVECCAYKIGTALSAQPNATMTATMRKTRHGRLAVVQLEIVEFKKTVLGVCALITFALFATLALRRRSAAFRQDPQDLRQTRHDVVETGSVPRLTSSGIAWRSN